MSNLSKQYGYYGGVTCENHYIPPPRPAFIPHPPTVPFTKDLLNTLQAQLSGEFLTEFLQQNAGSVVFRKLISDQSSLSGTGIRVFQINTQDNPSDIVTYDTLSSSVDLLLMDGGTF